MFILKSLQFTSLPTLMTQAHYITYELELYTVCTVCTCTPLPCVCLYILHIFMSNKANNNNKKKTYFTQPRQRSSNFIKATTGKNSIEINLVRITDGLH